MTEQAVGHHRGRHLQHVRRGLPCAGHARIIEDGQLAGDPRLQCLQQRCLHRQSVRNRLAEDLAEHHRQLIGLLTTMRPQLVCGELDSGRGGLPQRPLLIAAEDQRGQLLAARIREQPN